MGDEKVSNNKSNAKHTMSDLYQMQGMSLENKIKMTKRRIHEWVDEFGIDGVYISFSGGKDSTVLLHMAREEFPEMKAAFVDTGLEYPEIRSFIKQFDNVDILKPKKTFKKIIQEYGYPFISKETSGIIGGGREHLKYLMMKDLIYQTGERLLNNAGTECVNCRANGEDWRSATVL